MLGKVQVTEVVFVVVGVCVIAAAILFAKADWLFDDKGQPISYVCPATARGEPPRVQFTAADPLLGEQCPPVDRKVAAVILSIRRGVVPQPVQINSLAEFDTLEFFDPKSGLPIIFSGIAYPDSVGRPRFFRGAGYDPGTGRLLEPPTQETIAAAHAYFVEVERKRNEENERLAKEAKEREAQKQAEDKHRRAEAERQAAETTRGATATERGHMTPQAKLLAGTRVTENNLVFALKSCQRAGENLSCSGSITNTYRSTRYLSISARAIDAERAEYQVNRIQLGLVWGPILQYVPVEPNVTVNFAINAAGAAPTVRALNLVLEYYTSNRRGYTDPSSPDAEAVVNRAVKVYLRNIGVVSL